MTKSKFIKHGNSTIKLSAITGVSWKPEWTISLGTHTNRFDASVTIKTGADEAVASYDSDALAEVAYDKIVAKWEDA